MPTRFLIKITRIPWLMSLYEDPRCSKRLVLKTCRQNWLCPPVHLKIRRDLSDRGAEGGARSRKFLFGSRTLALQTDPWTRFNYRRPVMLAVCLPWPSDRRLAARFHKHYRWTRARSYPRVSKLESIFLLLLLFRVFEINALPRNFSRACASRRGREPVGGYWSVTAGYVGYV